MKMIIVISVVFVMMTLAPLLTAFIYYKTAKGVILGINQDKVRDPRYFSHSFSRMIKKALPDIKENTIKLSKEEHFLRPEDLQKIEEEAYRRVGGVEPVDEMVLAVGENFNFPEHILNYSKEVFSDKEITAAVPRLTVRAIYSGSRIYLGNRTSIDRWVDAEQTLAVYDDCNLGMAATAGHVLTLGKNVRFRRLYAPVVYFGQYPPNLVDPMEGRDEMTFMLPVVKDKKKEKHVTHENMTSEGTAPYSIVTTKTMLVEDAILQGDIHTDGSVRICEGAGVLGNIFAEKGILIEKGAFVVGNVFSQGKIEIRENVMIGRKGRVISVISRDRMTVGENTVIYGYVSSETEGVVCPIYDTEAPRYSGQYNFADYVPEELHVRFDNLQDYVKADDMAFRKDLGVVSADIPQGAISIRRSMFYGCANMKKLTFPDTLEEIQDFALRDCTALESMTGFENTGLINIGVSGLENCNKIKELNFPKTLKKLGNASCAGMTELIKVVFSEHCSLEEVGEHAFRDCTSLSDISLPDSVTKVGVSAFRGCSGLKKISIPKTVEDQPGIAELSEILPDAVVEFREEVTGA